MLATGMGVYAGGMLARDSVRHTRDSIYGEQHLADAEIEFTPATAAEIGALAEIPGVERTLLRFAFGSSLELPARGQTAAVALFVEGDGRQRINDLQVVEGRSFLPGDRNVVILERNFARKNGLRVGDEVELQTIGLRRPRIIGIGYSPDLLMVTINPNLLVPTENTLALVFAPMLAVSDVFREPLYNRLSVLIAPGADARQVIDAVVARLAGVDVTAVVPREQSFAYRLLEWDLRGFDVFVPAAFGLLAFVAFAGVTLTLTRMVRKQQAELGMLMAMGYPTYAVGTPVLLTALLLGLLAIAPGLAIALYLRGLIADSYAAVVGLPSIVRVADPEVLVVAAVVMVSVAAIAAAWPLRTLLRLAPHEAIRATNEEPPFSHVSVPVRWLERAGAVFGDAPAARYAARGLVRRRGRMLATCGAMAIALAMAIAFRTTMTSLERLTADLAARELWDATIDFRVPLDGAATARIAAGPGIAQAEPYFRTFVTLELPGGSEDYVALGVPPNLSLRRVRLESGRLFSESGAHEALLSRSWGKAGNLRLGDHVRVRAPHREVDVEIVGFLGDVTLGEMLVPLALAQHLAERPDHASGLLVRTDQPIEELRPAMVATGVASRVFGKSEVEQSVQEALRMMWMLIGTAAWVDLGVGLLLLFSTMHASLLERMGDYGLLTILGHARRTIVGAVLLETLWLGAAAMVCSLPFALGFALLLNRLIGEAWFTVPLAMSWSDFSWVLIPGLALLPITAIPALREILRMDLTAVVRARQFG